MTFGGHIYSLFVARVASFAPERSQGANDATRDMNKLYARQKSCDQSLLSIHLIPKWQPFYYSFVSVQIGPYDLVKT